MKIELAAFLAAIAVLFIGQFGTGMILLGVFTAGQAIHVWGKVAACLLDQTRPPYTVREYFYLRGSDVVARYFVGLMIALIVWAKPDLIVPGFVAQADVRIVAALVGLLGYCSDSVFDKGQAWLKSKMQ